MTALVQLRRSRLLAIVRSDRASHARRIVETLTDAGVDAIEVSLTTPGAIEVIQDFADLSSAKYTVGAGTVLTAEQTVAVAKAGARFIVTPGVSESVDEAV